MRVYLDQLDYSTPLHHLLVPLGETYSQFTNSLAQNIRQSQTSMSMLFGQHGKGKKSCVRYAIHQL